MLVKHVDKLTLDRPNLRFLIPLCGKSLDIVWLSSLGHDVVGIEFSNVGIEQFFSENNIPHTVSQVDSEFKLFKVNYV
jgi:thiopurine S-methyltransferase